MCRAYFQGPNTHYDVALNASIEADEEVERVKEELKDKGTPYRDVQDTLRPLRANAKARKTKLASQRASLASSVSMHWQAGLGLLVSGKGALNGLKGVFWYVYRAQEQWARSVITTKMLQSTAIKQCMDPARYNTLRMLLPTLGLPEAPLEIQPDWDQAQLTAAVKVFLAGSIMSAPDTTQFAPQGAEQWAKPPKSIWHEGKLHKNFANLVAMTICLVRQSVHGHIMQQHAHWATEWRRLADDDAIRGVLGATLEQVLALAADVRRGNHDNQIVVDLHAFNLTGEKPTALQMSTTWPPAVTKNFATRNGTGAIIRAFRAGNFHAEYLSPLLDALQNSTLAQTVAPPLPEFIPSGRKMLGAELIEWRLHAVDMVSLSGEAVGEVRDTHTP
jgi:hypothetical protein